MTVPAPRTLAVIAATAAVGVAALAAARAPHRTSGPSPDSDVRPLPQAGRLADPVAVWRAKQAVDSLFSADRRTEALPLLRRIVEADAWDANYWRALGLAADGAGHHLEAVDAYRHAWDLGIFSRPRLAVFIARAYAAADSTDAALRWLETSLTAPHENRPSLASDRAFASLRTLPRFARAAGLRPSRAMDRVEGWRLDIDFYVQEAQRMHAHPGRPAFSPSFAEAARRLRDRVPELDDVEVFVGLRKLATRLDDGHTGFSVQSVDGVTQLDLQLYAFADGLTVVEQGGRGGAMVGHRVLEFGGRSTADAMRDAAAYVSRDNPMSLLAGLPGALTTVPYLADMGLTNPDGSVTLRLEAPGGRRYDTTLVAAGPRFANRLPPPTGVTGDLPRYLRNTSSAYWLESLPEYDALYLAFNAVRNASGQTLAEFADVVRARLDGEAPTHLIVDMRNNGGGNSFLFVDLLRTIIHFAEDAPDHRIFVLTSRHTFSAAQNFINKLEQYTDAIFVGEPAGSRPNFTGESARTILPYSGILAFISTRNHISSDWMDSRLWIAPDVPVSLTSEDYFAGRDPAFDAVVALMM